MKPLPFSFILGDVTHHDGKIVVSRNKEEKIDKSFNPFPLTFSPSLQIYKCVTSVNNYKPPPESLIWWSSISGAVARNCL